jgi:predicted nucleic acid-binding protein
MILVDTNVVSEAMRPRPDLAVAAWFDAQPWDSLYLCTPVLAELRFGVEKLPEGRRKQVLASAVDHIQNDLYGGRILSFDPHAATQYAVLAATRQRQGRRIDPVDAFIAAIAAVHRATVATRDVEGFLGMGIEVVNPFSLP